MPNGSFVTAPTLETLAMTAGVKIMSVTTNSVRLSMDRFEDVMQFVHRNRLNARIILDCDQGVPRFVTLEQKR